MNDTITKAVYLEPLASLEERANRAGNSPYTAFAKVAALAGMNMRYELVAFDRSLPAHPWLLTRDIVLDAARVFDTIMAAGFIEDEAKSFETLKTHAMEAKHQELFDNIWNRYEEAPFARYVDRYVHRIRVNGLEETVRGKRCVDLGCGNGVFCFALAREGAALAAGVDFGADSVAFASEAVRRLGLADRTEFRTATVYDTGYPDDSFDFALQNGVFHHLDDENRAIREMRRILKVGGWAWYYTDGEGGISYDLWDASVRILRDVPVSFIENVLGTMNVSRDKTAHLMDGMNATYAHTSWAEITGRLAAHGFGEFRRLTGGCPTDFDLDVIEADPYGREKFGEGDLRVLCRLMGKQPRG
jgi:ubiquinone/menaquinone biosynthesis C-methylase UbiE